MKNRLVVVGVFSLMFAFPCFVQGAAPPAPAKESFDFRMTNWGMKIDEVKASEGIPSFSDTYYSLTYNAIFAGRAVMLTYYFDRKGLQIALYSFIETYSEMEGGFKAYQEVKDYLTTVYGKPGVAKIPQDVLDPYVKYQTHWRTVSTEIIESLTSLGPGYSLEIRYAGITTGATPTPTNKK